MGAPDSVNISINFLNNVGIGVHMWETCSVQINVELPRDIAEQAEEIKRTDPDFLNRVVLHGFTRRTIYRDLHSSIKNQDAGEDTANLAT